jgi:hypothetical protein
MGKLALVLAAICAGTFALSNTVYAIGSLPAIPTNSSDRQQYVNFMAGLSLKGSGHVTINGQDNLVTQLRPNAGFAGGYIDDLSPIITIVGNWGEQRGSSPSVLPPSPISVPDGGATVIMLGAALVILSVARRYLPGT